MEQQPADNLRSLVVIPTYNEKDNIIGLIDAVLKQGRGIEVLVVDDNSPDGTAEIVRGQEVQDPRVHLLRRSGKMGLGTAHIAGFRWAEGEGYDRVLTMDADFSHPPERIPAMLERSLTCEVVLGSRYVPGGGWENWPPRRVMLSDLSNRVARLVLGGTVQDCTGAFRCFATEALRQIPFDNIRARGFAFQEEMLWQCLGRGWRIGEVPITFRQRERGESKISWREVFGGIWTLLRLTFAPRRQKLRSNGN